MNYQINSMFECCGSWKHKSEEKLEKKAVQLKSLLQTSDRCKRQKSNETIKMVVSQKDGSTTHGVIVSSPWRV